MKKNLLQSGLILLALFLAGSAYSQNPSTIALKSHLTNIEGEVVANAKIDASLIVINSEGKQCFDVEQSIITKADGSFSLFMQDLPPIFTKGKASEPAVIQLTITSPSGDSWLEEDKFLVKYLFTKTGNAQFTEYSLTRMEEQKLNHEYATDIWKFDDVYPFAYIKSSFLVSFNDDITDAESLILAAEALFDANEAEDKAPSNKVKPPSSRGIKGGAAVGGYKKRY